MDSGNQAMVTRLAGNATTYKISNLDPGTKYMVYVFATNSVDNGDSTPGVPGYTSFGGERILMVCRSSSFTLIIGLWFH